jgi:hypothetical protein
MTRRAVPASAALAGVPGRGTVLARPFAKGWTMMGRPALDAIPFRVKVGVESVTTFLKK